MFKHNENLKCWEIEYKSDDDDDVILFDTRNHNSCEENKSIDK